MHINIINLELYLWKEVVLNIKYTIKVGPMYYVTDKSQQLLLTSSRDDSKFIPNATPMSPKREREKVPIVSCKFSLIITLRWLKKGETSVRGTQELICCPNSQIPYALKPNSEREEVTLELDNPVRKLMKLQYKG